VPVAVERDDVAMVDADEEGLEWLLSGERQNAECEEDK
jgi:hypothetical protein